LAPLQLGRCARRSFSALVFLLSCRGELLLAADDHQQLNESEACLFGVFPDLVCGLDGITDGFLSPFRFELDVSAGKLDHIEERILADDMSEGRNMLGRIRRTTVRLRR
jgi:hypothetical protein